MDEGGLTPWLISAMLILFADSEEDIRRFTREAEEYELQTLRLQKNPAKCEIGSPSGICYLGYRFERGKNGHYIAVDEDSPSHSSYKNWHQSRPERDNRAADILSSGILRQKDYSLLFENEDGAYDIPVMNTDIINIYSGVVLDAGFFKRAANSGITVNLFSETGNLLGRFTPAAPLKSPMVTLEQLEQYGDAEKRLWLATQFVLASIHNLRLVIRYYNKTYPDPIYDAMLQKIERAEKMIKENRDYDNLLLLEAQVRQFYYRCFDSFIRTEGFMYEKRSRRPPRNEVNAMISFGNTLLYNLLATEIDKTPLDVRVGFLHATNRREESLNLDLAEIFKPLLVDRVVFALINRKAVTLDDFTTDGTGVYLNTEGKRIFLDAFYDKLNTSVTVRDKSVRYTLVIKEEIQKLVRYFRQGENTEGAIDYCEKVLFMTDAQDWLTRQQIYDQLTILYAVQDDVDKSVESHQNDSVVIYEYDRFTGLLIHELGLRRRKTDRDYVEQIARKNGRVFPGELVFKFVELLQIVQQFEFELKFFKLVEFLQLF